MPDADDKIGKRAKGNKEANEDEQQDAIEELMSVKVSAERNNEPEEEEQQVDEDKDVQEDEEKEQNTEEAEMFKEITKKRCRRPQIVLKGLEAACMSMDAGMLVKFVLCGGYVIKTVPMHHAPDPTALALQVVKLFLSSKKFKSSKAWGKRVRLICWLSMVSAKPSADIMEQAKVVAKDWKEMIDKQKCCGELDPLAAWGLLHFLVSYNIVSEFDIHEIIHIFAMIPHKLKVKNTMKFCNDLGLSNRITDLIDYLIGNGQHLEVFHLAHVFNLEDKYHPLYLLKGYIEKAKQTAIEIFGNSITRKSMGLAVSKETNNLLAAQHLAKQKMTDCWERNTIMAEIKNLLGQYANKRRIVNSSAASTWNSQQPKKNQKSKKSKKEEQECHEEQNSQQWQEHSQNRLLQEKQHQLHKQENKPQLVQEPQNKLQVMHQHSKPHEMQQQQHISRPCTLKLPIPAVPVVLSAAQIQHFGHLLYTAMPGVQSYPAQSGWPGALGRPLTPQLGAPRYIGPPFNPFSPHPSFHLR